MSSMTIKTFMAVASKLPVETSVLLRGNHGIGKSQIVRQIARTLGFKQEDVIDRRLSQMSDGDMIGLPSTDGECTRFNPPDWYRQACLNPKVLLLDELNRATPEVMQAAFQIVLDRELNGWKLHPQTRVFSAINHSASYNVNEVDPALLDRFWTVDIEPSQEDWLNWAKEKDTLLGGNISSTIVDFITVQGKWLDPAKNADPTDVQPSRRSWERLSKALTSSKIDESPENDLFYPMCLGFIGTEASIAFTDFAKSADARVSGEDVINSYDKVLPKLKRLGQEKMNGVIEKVGEYITDNLNELTPAQGANLKKFMTALPGELRISCWSKLAKSGAKKLPLMKSLHTYVSDLILEIFNADKNIAAGAAPTTDEPEKKTRKKKGQ